MSADGMFCGPRLFGSSLMRIFPRNFWKDLRQKRRKVVIVLADNLTYL